MAVDGAIFQSTRAALALLNASTGWFTALELELNEALLEWRHATPRFQSSLREYVRVPASQPTKSSS